MFRDKEKRNASVYPVQMELAHALHFDANDLQANRGGYMTFRQRRRLRFEGYLLSFAVGMMAFLILLPIFIGGCWLVTSWQYHLDDNSHTFMVMLLLYLAFSIFMGLLFREVLINRRKLKSDTHKGRVESIVGTISHFKTTPSRIRGIEHYMVAGDVQFEVSKSGYDAFLPNVTYRLYYAPQTHRLLSAEPISQRIDESLLRAQFYDSNQT